MPWRAVPSVALILLLGCSSVPVARTDAPRASLEDALSRAIGAAVRLEAEGEGWVAYVVDEKTLGPVDRAGGEQRVRVILEVVAKALALDPALLGPLEWGEHPKPSACAPEMWPGTQEPTAHGLCVAFDLEHRPLWVVSHWSAAIAARRDRILPSRELLAKLKARAPADVIWNERGRLVLENNAPIYRFGSSTGASMDTTTVDAVTGAVLDVRSVELN